MLIKLLNAYVKYEQMAVYLIVAQNYITRKDGICHILFQVAFAARLILREFSFDKGI